MVLEQLSVMIVRHDLKVNQYLPPERELARQFGVSRNVVREAVKLLEARGRVKTRHGAGTKVVAHLDSPMSRALLDSTRELAEADLKLLETRRMIEVFAATVAAERSSPQDIKRLESNLERTENQLSDFDACVTLDLDFHHCLVAATHNEVLVLIYDSIAVTQALLRKNALQYSGTRVEWIHHQALVEALRNKQAPLVAEAMHRHLDVVLDYIRKTGDAVVPASSGPGA